MTFKAIAAQLDMPMKMLEQQSIGAWIDRRLLAIESEIVRLAQRYGIGSATEFLQRARAGKIGDTTETIDDFFNLDHLEAEQRRLHALKKLV